MAVESRSENDVGVAFEDRVDQARILLRIVLEIGVLNDDEIALGRSSCDRAAAAGQFNAFQCNRFYSHKIYVRGALTSGNSAPVRAG